MINLFELASPFHWFGRTNIGILMVVDASISTFASPGEFGIGRVARLINELARDCSSFSVDHRSPSSSPDRIPVVATINTASEISSSVRATCAINPATSARAGECGLLVHRVRSGGVFGRVVVEQTMFAGAVQTWDSTVADRLTPAVVARNAKLGHLDLGILSASTRRYDRQRDEDSRAS